MKFKYGINEIPPLEHLLLFGLQWLAIIIPIILIMGTAVTSLHPNGIVEQVVSDQRQSFWSVWHQEGETTRRRSTPRSS